MLLRTCILVAVMFGVAVISSEAAQAKKKGGVKGVITKVEEGTEKGEGTLTVKAVTKKKKTEEVAQKKTETKEMKIRVTKDTKIEKLIGKKKDNQVIPGSFSDLQAGFAAIITLKPGQSDLAEKVQIGKKKKKVA